jgi:hypothetical protein
MGLAGLMEWPASNNQDNKGTLRSSLEFAKNSQEMDLPSIEDQNVEDEAWESTACQLADLL